MDDDDRLAADERLADDEHLADDLPRNFQEPVGGSTATSAWGTLRRALSEFSEDNMTDRAAALTYYGLLSLFPALLAMVSLVGLFGDPVATTQKVTDIVTRLGPSSAADTFSGPIKSLTENRQTAGVLFFVGLATALYSASGYIGAFMRVANVIYESPEGRPFWKLRPLQILVALVMVVLVSLVALSLVLTGPIVDAVAKPLGIQDTAISVWNIAKWPVLIAVVVLMFSFLFYAAPNARVRGLRGVLPGILLALVLWVVASAAFAFYVSNFGSYDKTYGTLGGFIVFLVWLWITNISLLLGMEFNAERERSLQLKRGIPGAARELQLAPRAEPNPPKTA
jgi:membrane protein